MCGGGVYSGNVECMCGCVCVCSLLSALCLPLQLQSVQSTASRTTQEVHSPASGSEVRSYNTQRHVCLTTPHVLYSGHSVSLSPCAWPLLGVYCKVDFIVNIHSFVFHSSPP